MKIADDLDGTGMLSAATALDSIKADIVTQTLDTLNQGGNKPGSAADLEASYDFQKTVLSAVYEGKGIVTDLTG